MAAKYAAMTDGDDDGGGDGAAWLGVAWRELVLTDVNFDGVSCFTIGAANDK